MKISVYQNSNKSVWFKTFLALLCYIITFEQVSSRSSTATLLQVKDQLYIYDSVGILQSSLVLRPFAFIKDYASNITVSGNICYTYNIDQFQTQCAQKMPIGTKWIVGTPFDFKFTNQLLNQASDNNITAVIIIFDTPIDAAGYYTDPQLITLATISEGELIKAYSFPQRTEMTARLEHKYLTNCELVKSIQVYYIFLTIVNLNQQNLAFIQAYLLLSFGWVVLVWTFYDQQSTTLQRAFLAVPTLKLLQVFIYGIYVGECPWVNQIQARYMMMALVTISTIYQTVFIAIMLLISKGWNIARNSLSRNDLSSITLLMGAVYLTYSAYYVSINIQGMKLFIGFILNILYLALFVVVVKNTMETRQTLRIEYERMRREQFIQILPATRLKMSLMNKYFFIAGLYFFYELVINGLIPTFESDSDQFDPYANVIQQFYDLIIIFCLLVVFRPREWPEYFNLGFDTAFLDVPDSSEENRSTVPLLNAEINRKVFDSQKSQSSQSYEYNSRDPVLIVNPFTSYDSKDENAQHNDNTYMEGGNTTGAELSTFDDNGRYEQDYQRMTNPRHERGINITQLFRNIKLAFKIPSKQ